jgi:DNA-binding NarL/FixJ family response regulator
MSAHSTINHDTVADSDEFHAESRILLVEDNRGDAELIRVVLERNIPRTVEVVQCCRLNEAIQRLENEPFLAVVLDLGLPDSTGLKTLERVLEAAGIVPVVVLTGREDLNLSQAAIQLGAEECLCKNRVSGESLVRTIASCIERKKPKPDQ